MRGALDRFNDPETSHRRGYEQGAWEPSNDKELLLSAPVRIDVRTWIQRDIRICRADNLEGKAERQDASSGSSIDQEFLRYEVHPALVQTRPMPRRGTKWKTI